MKIKPLDIEKLNKGVGYIDNNGDLVKKPMNFSEKIIYRLRRYINYPKCYFTLKMKKN